MGSTELDGRVALVTGAAGERSIGRGIASALARRGADVAINDIAYAEEARDRVAEIEAAGRRSMFLSADVSDPAASERLVADTVATLGRLDVFVPTPESRTGKTSPTSLPRRSSRSSA